MWKCGISSTKKKHLAYRCVSNKLPVYSWAWITNRTEASRASHLRIDSCALSERTDSKALYVKLEKNLIIPSLAVQTLEIIRMQTFVRTHIARLIEMNAMAELTWRGGRCDSPSSVQFSGRKSNLISWLSQFRWKLNRISCKFSSNSSWRSLQKAETRNMIDIQIETENRIDVFGYKCLNHIYEEIKLFERIRLLFVVEWSSWSMRIKHA